MGDPLSSCFSCNTVNQCPFCVMFSATFFTIAWFLVMTLLFKVVSKGAADAGVRPRETPCERSLISMQVTVLLL